MRRIWSIVIIGVMLLDLISPIGQVFAAQSSCMSAASIADGYAKCIEIRTANKSKVYMLNTRLYRDRGIVVYGSPTSISENENTFVARTKPDPMKPSTISGGYYLRAGKNGEYRYHGFNAAGEKYLNMWFPDDVYVNPPDARTWIYRPWLNPNNIMTNVPSRPLSPGLYATSQQVARRAFTNVAKKAYEKFRIALGWTPSSVYPSSAVGYMLEDFVSIHQKTSTRNQGAGSMWSYSAKTNKVWVQTFPIPQLVKGDKKLLPIAVKLSVTSKDGEQEPFDFVKSKVKDEKSVFVQVTGTLGDQSYWNNFLSDEYLNRNDLLFGKDAWRVTLYDQDNVQIAAIDANNQNVKNLSTGLIEAKVDVKIMVKVKASQVIDGDFPIRAVVEANFVTGEKGSGAGQIAPTFMENAFPPETTEPPNLEVFPLIPSKAYDIVAVTASDMTNMDLFTSRTLFIDGIEQDDIRFFSGDYVFGVGSQGNHLVEIRYTAKDGRVVTYKKWMYVFDTLPIACSQVDGQFKVNRLITMSDCQFGVNDPEVTLRYPINEYSYSFQSSDGDISSIRMIEDGDRKKRFVVKSKGTYSLTVQVKNTLGRQSEPYTIRFEVQEDFAPTIVQHPFSGQVARGMPVQFISKASSGDGDEIHTFTHEIYWDSNQDDVPDQLVYQSEGPLERYVPEKLGVYELRSTASEQFDRSDISEVVAMSDFTRVTVKTYFQVGNFAPATELSLDQPSNRKKVDLFFMLDGQLPQSTTDYFNQNSVGIRNVLNHYELDADVRKWDGKSYTYSQSISKSIPTGTTYPTANIPYNEAGYVGTLYRSSVTTTQQTVDKGTYQTKSSTKNEQGTCANRVYVYYDNFGYYSKTSSTNVCPQILKFDDGKFKGDLLRYAEESSDPHCPDKLYPFAVCSRLWTAYYLGSVTWTYQVWVANWVTTTYYTGNYTGTVSMQVQERLTEPFSRIGTDKFIVYIAEDQITNQSQLIASQAVEDSKVIVVGNDGLADAITHDYFVRAGPMFEEIVKQIALTIKREGFQADQSAVLVDEPIDLHIADYDVEMDEIVDPQMMVIHNFNAVDNNLGALPGSTLLRDETAWAGVTEEQLTSFTKPGMYELLRKVKDAPQSNCATCDYGLVSNEALLQVFVHRKPIANLGVEVTGVEADQSFALYWLDESYDPDFENSRLDHGISETQIRYKKVGDERWTHVLPQFLPEGLYQFEYAVKDVNQVWSEVYAFTFQLTPEGTIEYGLIAEVNHTLQWLKYHQERKEQTIAAPKDFFAGEKMGLDARVKTNEVESVRARCALRTIHDGVVVTDVNLEVDVNDSYHYTASMYNQGWVSLNDPIRIGVYQVVFTVKYKNGTTISMEVPIRIIGSIYESYGVQRVK